MAQAHPATNTNQEVYLRQRVTGRLYIWTKDLAKRSDMSIFDPVKAKRRIEQVTKDIASRAPRELTPEQTAAFEAQAKENIRLAAEITAEENKQAAIDEANEVELIPEADQGEDVTPDNESDQFPADATEAEIQVIVRQRRIDGDPQVARIRSMRSKNQVEQYLLGEFGEDVEDSMSLKDLKVLAEDFRVERMFEG